MYSTQPLKGNKPKVNITYNGEVICTHRMTPKEVDKFVLYMREKGYDIDVRYNDGKC